jgi:hypothetical protein
LSGTNHHSQDPFTFEGFSKPNGTIVPDDVFDLLAPRLSDAELRVLLYIIRRTFGFGKSADAISLSQLTDGITTREGRVLDQGTGMSRKAVVAGVKGLQAKGVIHVQRSTEEKGDFGINVYSLRFKDGVGTLSNYPGNSKLLPGSSDTPPPPVTAGYSQDSGQQETDSQDSGTQQLEGGPRGEVVVSQDSEAEALYQRLCELGVHHHKARKLLRDYDVAKVDRLSGFLVERLKSGWVPQESSAAWLVAAIKGDYQLPASFRAQKEIQAEQQAVESGRQEVWASEQAEVQGERLRRLLELGIEQNVDKLWQEIQAHLRAGGQWSVAMAMCFLKHIEDGVAVLLVPARARKRLEGQIELLARVFSDFEGEDVTVQVEDLL